MVKLVPVTPWRVAVTRDDNVGGSIQKSVEDGGFIAVSCPVLIEGPPADAAALVAVSRDLESFDWVICASVRAVRAISEARGSSWPATLRTAAVGARTADAMRAAGADPIVGDQFNARSLLEKIRSLDTWHGRRVLIATVAGGRRELIDGLRTAGASVTELEAYTIVPRPAADIRRDWNLARPDAVVVGSAQTARWLADAVGIEALRGLKAIVPIGPTTAEAVAGLGIVAEPPDRATFEDAIQLLASLHRRSSR
jgi:uroporphyrinogen-III synthase